MGKNIIASLRSGSGVTAIEYAMVAALIALAIVTGSQQIGGSISGFFGTVAGAL